MSSPDDLPYRPCVGIMLLNAHGNVFVGQRRDRYVDAWQMPQGGIDEGEDPQAAALRELEEEIGTARAVVITQTDDWLTYDLPEELRGKVWKGRYRGQKQKWFVMRFAGREQDINLDTQHPEFRTWRWAPMVSLPELIVPFKRDIYTELVRRFGHLGG